MPLRLRGKDYFPEMGLPIGVIRHDEDERRLPLHSHDFSELIVILSGRGKHVVDGHEYGISAGDIFFFQGDQVHHLAETRGMSLYSVLFDPARAPLPYDQLRSNPGYQAMFVLEPSYRRQHDFKSRLHLQRTELAEVEELLRSMEIECIEKPPSYSAVLLAKLLELIVFLSRHYAAIQTPEGEALLLVGSVIVDLEEDFSHDWRLGELADRAQMSESSLLRVFRKATGHTPIEYLIHLRLQKAMALLRDTDRSVTDVALRVGFNDSNYFWRQFKKVVGMSPTEYRKGASGPLGTG